MNITDGIFIADADPSFLDPENADFRIPEGSPAQDVAIELTQADDWFIPADILALDAKRIVRTATTTDVGSHEAFTPLTGYEAWLRENTTDATFHNSMTLAATDDLDGDGINNLLEYAFGTNPTSEDPSLFEARKLKIIGTPAGDLPLFNFSLTNPRRIDLNYTIEESETLETASWKEVDSTDFQITTMATGALLQETWTHQGITTLPETLFYRMKIEEN